MDRVFAIPELVTEILLQMSTYPHSNTCFIGGYPEPEAELFVLQRVSKAFQAAIFGSKTLKQRMFLAPYPRWMGTVYTLDWLFDVIGVLSKSGEPFEVFTSRYKRREKPLSDPKRNYVHVSNGKGANLLPSHVDEGVRPYSKTPEASWRTIKAHCLESDSAIVLHCHHRDGRLNVLTLSSAQNLTLGEVHDGMRRLATFIWDHAEAELFFEIPERTERHDEDYYRKWFDDAAGRLGEQCALDETWR